LSIVWVNLSAVKDRRYQSRDLTEENRGNEDANRTGIPHSGMTAATMKLAATRRFTI
jgi:hypothetical protein